MNTDRPFDLESDEPQEGGGQPELDWSHGDEPTAEPVGPVVQRGRRRGAKAARKSRRQAPAEGAPGRVAGLLGWIVSPTFYYLLGFFSLVALTLSLFNPVFGVAGRAWPHEVLGAAGSGFRWEQDQVRAITLLTTLLSYVIALLMRPGPGRAIVVVLGSAVSWTALQPDPNNLGYFILPIATALTAGALLATGAAAAPKRRWIQLLLVGVVLLGAQMFLPWDSTRMARQGVEGSYASTATSTVDLYRNPPQDFLAESDSGYLELIGLHLPATVGLAMLIVGLLAFVGLGGRWARWAAGSLLLILFFGVSYRFYGHGAYGTGDAAGLPMATWQQGAAGWAENWYPHALAYALPFAAALAELVRGRRP